MNTFRNARGVKHARTAVRNTKFNIIKKQAEPSNPKPIRIVEFVTSQEGRHKTITELHMLADLIV